MKQIVHTIILCLVAFATTTLNAQDLSNYKNYEQKHFRGLRYGLFKPANYDATKSYPLIVYLHGSRDTVSRDLNWYQESIQK